MAARDHLEKAIEESGTEAPEDPAARSELSGAYYDLACVYVAISLGRSRPGAAPGEVPAEEVARLRERAFRSLRSAIDLGFGNAAHLASDADLVPLHDDPRWSELLDRMK